MGNMPGDNKLMRDWPVNNKLDRKVNSVPRTNNYYRIKATNAAPSSNTYRGHSLTGPSTLGVRAFMKNDLKWISIEYHAHVTL